MIGFILGAMFGATVSAVIISALVSGQRQRAGDIYERVSDDSRVNLTHLAEVRQMRAMLQREGVGGNW